MHITLLATLALSLQTTSPVQETIYKGWMVTDVEVTCPADIETLRTMGARSLACFDHGGNTQFLMTQKMVEKANDLHIETKVTLSDLSKFEEDMKRVRNGSSRSDYGSWYSDFKSWPEVNSHIQQLASSNPELASVFEVGSTHEGRTIYGIRITAPGDASNRNQILFNGCQHAREWVAVMVPVYIAEHLIEGWYDDPEIQSFLDSTELIIVPIVNPDGYEYTYELGGDRFWRKNRRNNSGSCEGVDLNRNWDIDWNGGDSTSTSTCSDVYVGPSVFSEPETQAMRALIDSLPNFIAHIDFHSYSQLILKAWGYTSTPHPNDDTIQAIGDAMREAIISVHGESYIVGTPGDVLYFADGTFQDWTTSQGAFGYTVELRPTGSPGFDLPPSEIIPTCEENFEGILAMLRFISNPISITFPNGLPTNINPGESEELLIRMQTPFGGSIDEETATVHIRYGESGTEATQQLIALGGGLFEARIPGSPCGLSTEFWFDVETTTGQYQRYPQGNEVVTIAPAQTLESFSMDENPGWSTEGMWSWGQPTGGGGQYGNADPTSGFTGENVYGYNLNGDYENNLSEKNLTVGPLDLSESQNTQLQFARYLNVEQPAYDHASIHVKSGINSWQLVWTNTSEITDSQWQSVTYDISSIADESSEVWIRWTMGTTDTSWRYSGWNIDDVRLVTSVESGIVGDVNCDGVVNVEDILLVVASWGPCNEVCAEDIVPDFNIGVEDILLVIANW
ncbi:MAG: M14 family zinc carboxypeptidase [Phycisphaerales bacterium]|nr:M14 family zinc carboxypeptidase [Phycisphaerales bacterium]